MEKAPRFATEKLDNNNLSVYKDHTGGYMATIEQLEQEISKLNGRLFRSEIRLEALTRLLTIQKTITIEDYQEAVREFQTLNGVVAEINNINNLMDKVTAAAKFNEKSKLKITADDLGIRKILEDVGGTSDSVARMILSKNMEVPMSRDFVKFMVQFVDPTKTPSPDVKYPDQVINGYNQSR